MVELSTEQKVRGFSLVVLLTVLAMVLTLGIGMLHSRPAGATSSWTAVNPPVPSNFTNISNESTHSISCASAGNCVAVGAYDPTSSTYALIETETNGVWASVTPPMPSDAATSSPNDYLDQVSCSSVGNCVAVGFYNLASDGLNYLPLILVENNGVWSAVETTLPSDIVAGNQNELYSVNCPSDNNCTATGYYQIAAGAQALIVNEVNGVWTAVDPTPLPAGAGPQGSHRDVFQSVTCTLPGNCAAVGWYYNATTSDYGFLIDTSVNGVWSNQTAALPSDAVVGSDTGLYGVSCPSSGSCVAGGAYDTANGEAAVVLAQNGGTWTASAAPLPADSIPADAPGSIINAVHCASAGNCTAVGSYASGPSETTPLLAVQTNSVWSNVVAPTPSDMSANIDNGYYDISCSTATNCLALGGYYNGDGELPLLGIETNGVWSQQPVALPAGSGPSLDDGSELYSGTCTQQGACQMFGYSYSPTLSATLPIVASGNIVGIPTPPTAVIATAGDGKATVSWSAPVDTGSSPVTSYTASAVEAANDPTCTTTSATTCVIAGLTNAKTYSVTVTATNAAGTSSPSVAVSVTPHGVLAATGFNAQIAGETALFFVAIGGGFVSLAWYRRRTVPMNT
jgi:hypothetical protein